VEVYLFKVFDGRYRIRPGDAVETQEGLAQQLVGVEQVPVFHRKQGEAVVARLQFPPHRAAFNQSIESKNNKVKSTL